MRWNELQNETCPVARGLSVVGDRWTLLVLRDCFRGLRRFDDLHASLGITRHVLSDRLKGLEAAGVLERRQYSNAPPRHEYRLTDKGRDLYPVLIALIRWGETHQPRADVPDFTFRDRHTGAVIEPVLTDRRTGRELDPRQVSASRGETG